jgi:hypothetical protein
MVEVRGAIIGPVFGVDSKKLYKEWYDPVGLKKEFRCMLGEAVNPDDNVRFDKDYDRIMDTVLAANSIPKNRRVCSAAEIGSIVQDGGSSTQLLPGILQGDYATGLCQDHLLHHAYQCGASAG